jgi:hypothetical protein
MTSKWKKAGPTTTTRTAIVRRPGATRWAALAAIVAMSIANVAASGRDHDDDGDDDGHDYAIGLWGDVPYSVLQETGVQNLIKDMNRQHLAFSVNDGDLKQGNGAPVCDDALYTKALGYFNSLRAPAMFTPGDNDWTDCDRPNNGGFDSLERLSHERQVFFSDSGSLGQHTLHQEVQTDPLCLGGSNASPTPEGCVENRRWTVGRVTYATLNIQGSCNNLCGVGFNEAEYAARNAANIQWMEETFEKASSRHSVAIMLISQGDPGFSQFEFDAPLRDPKTLAQTSGPSSTPAAANFDGFQEFLVALRAKVIAFGKPVDYVHGDSHYFRIDKPLLDPTGVDRLQNFTRIETFGDHPESGNNDVQWVKVLVDPGTPEVFAYQPQIIPANQAVVPIP